MLLEVGNHRPDPALRFHLRDPHEIFNALLIPGLDVMGGSIGPNFSGTPFGRDGEKVAFDTIWSHPQIAWNEITFLAKHQSPRYAPTIDASKGSILHEHRLRMVNGEPINGLQEQIFDTLALQWKRARSKKQLKELQEFTYYGTVDATPLFVMLVNKYAQIHGDDILHKTVERSDGAVTIEQSRDDALGLLERRLKTSRGLNLIHYKPQRPGRSHAIQTWTDSETGIIYENGDLLNTGEPIYPVAEQGYTYAAFESTADRIEHKDPHRAARYRKHAANIQRSLITHFWNEERGHFNLALNFDHKGQLRPVTTKSSEALRLLNTPIFDNMEEDLQRKFVGALAREGFGPDFLTPWGLRVLALRYFNLFPYIPYHGPPAVWPQHTDVIAQGYRRHGMHYAGEQLENSNVNGFNATGEFGEWYIVMPDNRAYLGFNQPPIDPALAEDLAVTNDPEPGQAWSGSSADRVEHLPEFIDKEYPMEPKKWQKELEKEITYDVDPIRVMRQPEELAELRSMYGHFVVNKARGQEEERKFIVSRRRLHLVA